MKKWIIGIVLLLGVFILLAGIGTLVYLKDFIISDGDANKPMVLRDVELHFRYDGITLPSKAMTWSSYLKTLPWCST